MQDRSSVDVTLSIVNTNNRELLRTCLQTVKRTVVRSSYEVIVVDNASDDGSAEMVETEFAEFRLIRNASRDGYGSSHNRAIREATGQYVLILNEDMEMLDGAIDRMVARAREIPELGVMGCRILNPDLSLQHSCFNFPTLRQELFEALFPYTLIFPDSRVRSKMYHWRHDRERTVDVVVGCCMLFSPAALERVGGFDPQFFVYSEEFDVCMQTKKAGLQVVFTPDAEMIHYGGQTSKRMSLRMALVQIDSRMKFFRKHYGPLRTSAFRLILLLGAFIRSGGWAVRALFSARDPDARAKLNEYWSSLKVAAAGKL